jgi:hypothetical protein
LFGSRLPRPRAAARRAALLGSGSAAATRLAPCRIVIVPREAAAIRSEEYTDLAWR